MLPCFLLRDGRKQLFEQVPDGLALYRYQDQAGQVIRALLDPASQQRLIAAQPQPRRNGKGALLTTRHHGREDQAADTGLLTVVFVPRLSPKIVRSKTGNFR